MRRVVRTLAAIVFALGLFGADAVFAFGGGHSGGHAGFGGGGWGGGWHGGGHGGWVGWGGGLGWGLLGLPLLLRLRLSL